MAQDKPILYSLRSELTNTRDRDVEHCSFECLLNVRFLRETGRNDYFYDSELKMNFVDISALADVYEVEIVDSFVTAAKRLNKAEEFIRRANYRYDWIQVRVNRDGVVKSIENKDELKERWSRLKEAIRKDYKGDVVEHSLEKLDKEFETEEQIWSAIYQYLHFGLLFPHIPQKHSESWENKRIVEFSEYENEKFEEHISYTKTEDNLRIYNISGQALEESISAIDKYEGQISVATGDTFPDNVKLDITFRREDITNQWSFSLLRYN